MDTWNSDAFTRAMHFKWGRDWRMPARAIYISLSGETLFKLAECNANGLCIFSFSDEKAQMEWQKLTLFLNKIKQCPAPSHPQKHKTTNPSASNSWLCVSSSKENWKSPAPRKSVLGSGEALYRSWESSMGSEGSDSFSELWHQNKTKQKHNILQISFTVMTTTEVAICNI